ncbi:MAG: STAS domain-containing protein [Planctomycetaceae bacterium]|nr:STAS domain-containing protein [Planctomycetaceae bacterium]
MKRSPGDCRNHTAEYYFKSGGFVAVELKGRVHPMGAITCGCELDVQRGPDWLLVKVNRYDPAEPDLAGLAERITSVLEQHFTYRLVLQLERVPVLDSVLIRQLLALHRWIEEHGGVMRVCGLSPYNRQVLHSCQLDQELLPYRDYHEAVMGAPPWRRPR